MASFRPSNFPILSAASRDLLNPLPPPSRRLEGISEILCFVDDLAVAKLHSAHRVCQPPPVRDCIFRDPEIPVSENPLDVEAGRLAGMMTPQGLQIASPEDSLARLGIITNDLVIVNIMFRVCIADCRRAPVRIQGFTYLRLLRRLIQVRFGFHDHLPCGMKPGPPVFTTSFSRCLV
jgi:hypothetical protein